MRNKLFIVLAAGSVLSVTLQAAVRNAVSAIGMQKTPVVGIVEVQSGSVGDAVMAEGQIVPVHESDVAVMPQYTAQVEDVLVNHGSRVQKGQVLAILNPVEQRDEVQQAQASAAASASNYQLVLHPHRPQEIHAAWEKVQNQANAYQLVLHPYRPEQIQEQRDKVAADIHAADAAKAKLDLLLHGNRPQQVAEAEAAVQAAQAQVTFAKDTLDRDKTLLARNLVARADVEKDATDLAIVQGTLDTAQQNLSLMKEGFRQEDIDAAKAALAQADATRDQDQDALNVMLKGSRPEAIAASKALLDQARDEYTIMALGSRPEQIAEAADQARALSVAATHQVHIYNHRFVAAPISGVVVARNINPGELSSPQPSHADDMNPTVDNNKNLFMIADDSSVEFEAAVDQRFFSSVHVGQTTEVDLEAFPGRHFTGTIARINPRINSDRTQPGKAVINPTSPLTFTLWVHVANPKHELVSGQIGMIKVNREREGLVIPQSALASFTLGEGVVYVEKSGVLAARSITYDGNADDRIRVTSGLSAGEHVVVSSTLHLQDGMHVQADLVSGAEDGKAF